MHAYKMSENYFELETPPLIHGGFFKFIFWMNWTIINTFLKFTF